MTDFSAEDALEARQRNPRAAVEMARAVLRTTEDRAEWAIAERAIGLALREMHDFPVRLGICVARSRSRATQRSPGCPHWRK